ncbi:MAG: hypothetical protein ACRD0Q_03015 [Acidimicrobiales bacterium]
MTDKIDIRADLNDEDDDGNGWSLLSCAPDPSRVTVGRVLVVGNESATAAARIVAVDPDGMVHFSCLPGPVADHPALLAKAQL